MQVIEAISINQKKYEKIYIFKNKDGLRELSLSGLTLIDTYTDIGQVDKDLYLKELVDYFLLDKEGIEDIFRNVLFNIEPVGENDKVLVLVI